MRQINITCTGKYKKLGTVMFTTNKERHEELLKRGQFTVNAVGNWFVPKVFELTVAKEDYSINVNLEYKDLADGNLANYDTGFWNEEVEMILDGGGASD